METEHTKDSRESKMDTEEKLILNIQRRLSYPSRTIP